MFNPNLTYTNSLVNNLLKIEKLKTEIGLIDLSYNLKSKLALNAKTLDIFHLCNFLGIELTIKDAEKIASIKKFELADDERAHIVRNFRNALEFSRSNISDTYSELDTTIILHLHKLVLSTWRETWEADFRKLVGKINSDWGDDWVGLRDQSIASSEVQNEIIELIDWYKSSVPTTAPVVRIALVLLRLIEIAPFNAGNKLTLFALADYLLYKNGLASNIYCSTVRFFGVNNEKIYNSLLNYKKSHDPSLWVEQFTSCLLETINNTREEISQTLIEEDEVKKQPFLDLNKRQLKILQYLQTIPSVKREDYCQMMEVSTMTAFRDLDDLVRKKLLKIEGKGRGTRYRLTSS